jgi:UDP-MurNAc hydroxylase
MRFTSLGHATALIETADLTILTDPVLSDGFLVNLGESCPRRVLEPSALPEVDVLYISHRHTDHFDIPSLARLVEVAQTVVCPQDAQILKALAVLGFEDVHPIEDNQVLRFGSTELVITPSKNPVPEHGLLVSDRDGRIWNQVDTLFDLKRIRLLQEASRRIDLHLANFNPILPNECISNGDTTFPYEVYEELFEVVRAANARLAVPFANGHSWSGRYAWWNQHYFPVSHQTFLDDVRSLGSDIRAEMLYPGDVVEIANGRTEILEQAVPELCRTTDRATHAIAYDPTAYIPAFADHNPYGFETSELERSIAEVFELVNKRIAGGHPLVAALARWGTRMSVAVSFPTSDVRHWHIDFAASPLLRPGAIAGNYHLQLSASSVHAVHRGFTWDEFSFDGYRCHHSLHRVREEGLTFPVKGTQGRLRSHGVPAPIDFFWSMWDPQPDPFYERQLQQVRSHK